VQLCARPQSGSMSRPGSFLPGVRPNRLTRIFPPRPSSCRSTRTPTRKRERAHQPLRVHLKRVTTQSAGSRVTPAIPVSERIPGGAKYWNQRASDPSQFSRKRRMISNANTNEMGCLKWKVNCGGERRHGSSLVDPCCRLITWSIHHHGSLDLSGCEGK
jgi:hypothetical protein